MGISSHTADRFIQTSQNHRDSFGTLATALTGGSQWTLRLLRGTKIAKPHIAKGDVFTYTCQYNHDKTLQQNADDIHIHYMPIGTVTAGQVISLDYAWGWFTTGEVLPNTLPNTGNITITLAAGDQYKFLIKQLDINLTPPTVEGYSSELFVEVTRLNTAADTYPGEFALIDQDSHYPTAKIGSYNVTND